MTGAGNPWQVWMRVFRPCPRARWTVVVFPHAGGSASFYRRFALAFPPQVQVAVVQYPGRSDRMFEPYVDTMPRLADELAGVIVGSGVPVPVLFGHSMGGAVAYEVARRLECAATGVHTLFVSGRPAPTHHRGGTFHLTGDDRLVDELCRLGNTDPALFEEVTVKEMVLATARNDYRLIESYRFTSGPPLRCPLHVLVSDRDTEVTPEEAEAWRDLTLGPSSVRHFPGDHFYLTADPTPVVAAVTDALGDARGMDRPQIPWLDVP